MIQAKLIPIEELRLHCIEFERRRHRRLVQSTIWVVFSAAVTVTLLWRLI